MSALVNNPSDVLNPVSRKPALESDAMLEAGRAEERVRNLYQKSKEKALETEERFETYVRAHPVKTVLIATGVGVVFGFLLGRRR